MGLARPILIKRINNEIRELDRYLGLSISEVPDNAEFPIVLSIMLMNSPAKISENEMAREHGFDLVLSEEYPFERPRAKWKTDIFHPNIMMPNDGGFVCVKTLDNWSFGSNMTSFVKGVENLLADPNPMSPYGTDSCMRASRWYLENKPRFDARVSYGEKNA
ncbi:MAG: ubiquitin-conjugating enzyme E2 [Candidatus Methanomethylophilaceae archaeon]